MEKAPCGLARKPFHNQFAHVDENGSFWIEGECPLCSEMKNAENRIMIEADDDAFPLQESEFYGSPGMSIRVWLAGQALACLRCSGCGTTYDNEQGTMLSITETADAAVRLADAVLARLNKPF